MGKTSKRVIKESISELEKWYKKTLHTKMNARVKVLIAIKKKEYISLGLLSADLNKDISTIQRWLKTYTDHGIEKLCAMETRIKPSKVITQDIHDWLDEILNDSSAPAKGYKHLQILISEKFNKQVHYHALYYYVRKYFKTKLKSPRKTHMKKDHEAIEAFLKTT